MTIVCLAVGCGRVLCSSEGKLCGAWPAPPQAQFGHQRGDDSESSRRTRASMSEFFNFPLDAEELHGINYNDNQHLVVASQFSLEGFESQWVSFGCWKVFEREWPSCGPKLTARPRPRDATSLPGANS